jgi:adenosylcobinamide kinase/adenosylcobinamide-phosphate guanylyltransferase
VSAGHWSHVILGGARSGKSRHALDLARSAQAPRTAFLATAEPRDGDMAMRIAGHRSERPPVWLTVEEPFDVVGTCGRLVDRADLVILDCLTLWVSNRLLRGDEDQAILGDGAELARLLASPPYSIIVVSNEVGEGVHPPTVIGLRFRDILGLVNQQVAAAAQHVTLMVAGIPVRVKHRPNASAAVIPASHDRAPEAP